MGQGLAYLGSLALLNQIAPPHQRGEVTSGFYIATYLGVALPVLGVGFGAQLVGCSWQLLYSRQLSEPYLWS